MKKKQNFPGLIEAVNSWNVYSLVGAFNARFGMDTNAEIAG